MSEEDLTKGLQNSINLPIRASRTVFEFGLDAAKKHASTEQFR
jgi:hypothetical protein